MKQFLPNITTILLIIAGMAFACSRIDFNPDSSTFTPPSEEYDNSDSTTVVLPPTDDFLKILQKTTWILIEKESDEGTEMLPFEKPYPITLIFKSDTTFRGRHDPNTYLGGYNVKEDNILFVPGVSTDGYSPEWYWFYLRQLPSLYRIFLTDSTMHLANDLIKYYFLSLEKFERDYFELEEWYKF